MYREVGLPSGAAVVVLILCLSGVRTGVAAMGLELLIGEEKRGKSNKKYREEDDIYLLTGL
jgi:hypothetical protein